MTALPHRSSASGDEVVQIVDAAFSAVRAERDEARDLLREVASAPHAVAWIAPDVMERIQRLTARAAT